MKNSFVLLICGLYIITAITYSCRKDLPDPPTITTAPVTQITATSAFSGGDITNDGGSPVTARGVCWSTSQNPSVDDAHTSDSSGTGSYASTITGLQAETGYYVRAYATNSGGTAYGQEVVFDNSWEQSGTFIDIRDNKEYDWVSIGDQVWMAENLAYLPSVSPSSEGSITDPYYYVYDYQGSDVTEAIATANFQTYGVLYNWPAALTACPDGWHLPTDGELTELENYLADNGYNYDGTTGGVRDKIAKAMASDYGWSVTSNTGAVGNSDYPATRNLSGFTALPGGYRYYDGYFDYVGNIGHWWSATEFDTDGAWYRSVYYNTSRVYQSYDDKEFGFSVRCLMD